MDSGHPPTFGFYLAWVWSLFGKSLETSHLAMLPFLLGIVWQSWRVGERVLGEGWAYLFILILLVNPVVAGQCVLVSPDVVLIFFFLFALNSLFREKKILLSLAILGLAAVSMRGMMVVATLFLFQLGQSLNLRAIINLPKIRLILPYVLGGSFALIFFIFHYTHKGWIGYHAGSSWAEAFQVVDFKYFIKNIILLIWRFIDFGHLFIAVPIVLLTIDKWRSSGKLFPTTRLLWLLLIVLILVLTPTLVAYKGLLNHRYLLPIYITACLLCIKLISDMKRWRQQIWVSSLVLVGLASGNFWVYRQPISTGWDSTFAHLPYYRLRNQAIQFIDNQQISYSEIGTEFSNLRSFALVDLKNTPSVTDFARLDLSKNHYVFYSNVMNELTEDELVELRTHWQPMLRLKEGQVEVILYKK